MCYYFVENLTLITWLGSVCPRLIKEWGKNRETGRKIYFIDGAKWMVFLAQVMAKRIGVDVEELHFRMIDIRDEKGQLLRLRIAYDDLARVQDEAVAMPIFQEFITACGASDRLTTFLAKNTVTESTFLGHGSFWRALYIVQVCQWKMCEIGAAGEDAELFIERRPWFVSLSRYAAIYGIETIPVPQTINWRGVLKQAAGLEARWALNIFLQIKQGNFSFLRRRGPDASSRSSRVAVLYYGNFNLGQPELYSDIFFWQESELPGRNLIAVFRLPNSPLDANKLAELNRCGIGAVALNSRAASTRDASIFSHLDLNRPRKKVARAFDHSPESVWLNRQVNDFEKWRRYWSDFFSTQRIKVYTTWYKYDAEHCAMAEAIRDQGGALAIYQRAYESHPSAETTVVADIVFSFSQDIARVESLSNSTISYCVTTGYLGDHRFAKLRERANSTRSRLYAHGARRIICYFDENSHADNRWHTGHDYMRIAYQFLLEQVLRQPDLGLIFKPKVPFTLRTRLGPVLQLLERALATGRCFVYESGRVMSFIPPAEAALASDLVIHGHLAAVTAGLEAALTGVPTLLFDGEGWPTSPLYQLGVGRVVFNDWQTLWQACEEHWSRPDGLPGLGDWSPMLDQFDPFRDGRAAERMGTYLKWLIEGFDSGLPRGTVLADAAERYCKIWGKDKVVEVRPAKPYLVRQRS